MYLYFAWLFLWTWRLCVIGLAASHIAFKDEGGITAIDYNVGKSDRSGVKVTGKRKKVLFLDFLCKSFKKFVILNENIFFFMLNAHGQRHWHVDTDRNL